MTRDTSMSPVRLMHAAFAAIGLELVLELDSRLVLFENDRDYDRNTQRCEQKYIELAQNSGHIRAILQFDSENCGIGQAM